MLSDKTATQLSALTYRADAKRQVCLLPLGGIFWDDEMPQMRDFVHIPEEDRTQILRMFGIRLSHWKGETLTESDHKFWDEINLKAPTWALFRRQHISAEDLLAQNEAEEQTARELEALFADADEVTITEKDGVQSFAATFKLKKDEPAVLRKKPWWKRLWP
jgi:hypothetical protein